MSSAFYQKSKINETICNHYLSSPAFASCNNNPQQKDQTAMYKAIGTIKKYDASLDSIISQNTKPEIFAEGFEWSEGPLWIEK
ncbi:MAG: hypothetical protein SGI96_07125 [Bacteroidota bacterium]|nr:hypothetical protein [Bacteroidota bacterium]